MKKALIVTVAAVCVGGGFSARAADTCVASIFTGGFDRPLADGKRHTASELLIAHRKLAMGSRVRITSARTGKTVVATVRDRGPFTRGLCADLSPGVARALGASGLVKISMESDVKP